MKVYVITVILIVLMTYVGLLTADDIISHYPRTIVAEFFPSVNNQDNNRAYQGINYLTDRYNKKVFLPIRYYHSTVKEKFSSASVDNFIDGKDNFSYASLFVNNKSRISNTKLPIESGKPYDYLVQKQYYEPTPIKMDFKLFDLENGETEVELTLLSKNKTFDNALIRFVLVEDNVTADVTNLARDIVEFNFSLTNLNSPLILDAKFTLNEDYSTNDLKVVSYVIYNDEIIQATSSYDNYPHHLRAVFTHPRIDVGPSSGLFEAEYFYLYNFGATSDLTVEVLIDDAPEGWLLTYCDDHGSCYFGPKDFTLNDGEATSFHSNIVPESSGMIDYHFLVQSESMEDYIIPARFITHDVNILVVDGDGWENYEYYIEEPLQKNGYSFGTWCTTMSDIRQDVDVNTVIWISGEREPALSKKEISFLKRHLDKGNDLLLSGQNISHDLVESDIYNDIDFMGNYLNTYLVAVNNDDYKLTGVYEDPISSNITISLNNGDSADNQDVLSYISVKDEHKGVEIFHYDNNKSGAVRSLERNLVYLAFGIEGIDNYQDRQQILLNILNWFQVTDITIEILPEIDNKLQLYSGYPNPYFSNATSDYRSAGFKISYQVSENRINETSLKIYNIKGQVIKDFEELPLYEEEYGYVIWNGKDISGNNVSNGIYLYLLSDGVTNISRKLSIIR